MLLKGMGGKKLRIVRLALLFIITIFFKSTICLDRFHQNWTFSSLVVYPCRLKLSLVGMLTCSHVSMVFRRLGLARGEGIRSTAVPGFKLCGRLTA